MFRLIRAAPSLLPAILSLAKLKVSVLAAMIMK